MGAAQLGFLAEADVLLGTMAYALALKYSCVGTLA